MQLQQKLPRPKEVIKGIKEECPTINDENRWLAALISDTGMQITEATGLHLNDFHLYEDIPYVDLKPHPWRSLKTKGSKRYLPLIGSSAWAVKQIAEANNAYVFPDMLREMKLIPTLLMQPSANGLNPECQKAV